MTPTKHLAERILTSKAALEGERKQVTVLFADLKGSMELLADRDPEEARKLLDPVLEHMMEAVHRYEGTVNQVMGDGIMALFGAPLAHEDHAVRACYAALRMQEAVKRYADGVFRTHGVPVRIRVGLNSGEVVVRSIGSDLHMDYTAVGQTTHLAARMEQIADPGTIRLTADTLHLAEGFVQVQALGPTPVKGLLAPVEVYELTGVSPVRSRLRVTAARGLTKFVGRDAEMDTLFESLPTARLLLLVNYRPEYRHGWNSKTYYRQLQIDPLAPANAGALLVSLFGDNPALQPLTRLLIQHAEGNPFFLEESVRDLVETGMLRGERGAYQLTRPIQAIEIPATVQVMLAARIDRLPGDDKLLLQTASVIGKDVPFVLLHAIAGLPEDALHRGLAHLQAAEFLYETRLFPDPEYTFKHALTHEVAYGTLLQDRRKALHARIVGAIERAHPGRLAEHVERLAHHAVRGELWEQAAAYLRQAGDKALARSANREAVSCFELALTALEHLPETRERLEQAIDLHLDLGTTLMPLGEFGRIAGCLGEAEALAKALGDQRRLGQVSARLCQHLTVSGHAKDAIAFGENARAIAESLRDVPLQVEGNRFLGMACLWSGDLRRAVGLFLSVVPLLRDERSGYPAVAARFLLTRALADLGQFEEGIAHGQEGLRIAEALAHPYSVAYTRWYLGYIQTVRGEFGHAVDLLDSALAVSRERSLTLLSAQITGSLGYTCALLGRVAEGIPLLEQAQSATEAMGFQAHRLFLVYLGEAYALADRLEEASECAGRALALSHECGQRGYEAWALRVLAEIAARRDPPEHAEGCYREALALAEELGMRPLAARCHLGLGTLLRNAAEPDRAHEHLNTAVAMLREMGMTYWLTLAEAELRALEPAPRGAIRRDPWVIKFDRIGRWQFVQEVPRCQ